MIATLGLIFDMIAALGLIFEGFNYKATAYAAPLIRVEIVSRPDKH